MSIIESLIKVVDPMRAKQIEAERKSAREQIKQSIPGAPPEPITLKHFRCKVCEATSENGEYCKHCLADTMVEF